MGGDKPLALFLGLLVLSILVTAGECAVMNEGGYNPADYLLANGTVEYDGSLCWQIPAAANQYGIEVFMNVTLAASNEVTSLSSSTVEFVSTRYYSAQNVYQRRDSVIYHPTSYGIRYYDSGLNLIGTDDTTYTITCQVNKETGVYTLYQAPQGAAAASFTAYYSSTYVYEYTAAFPIPFDKVGELNGYFLPNASDFTIGTAVRTYYTVSGESEYMGYDTWVVEPSSNPEGYDVFDDHIEFEKTSGLFVGQDSEFGETNLFDFEYHLWATDFADVIVRPWGGLPADTLIIGVGVVGVIAVVSIAVVLFRRRAPSPPVVGQGTGLLYLPHTT